LNKQRETIYSKRNEILQRSDLKEMFLPLLEKNGHTIDEYEKKEQEVGPESMRQIERVAALRVIDNLWIEHLENMDSLKDSVRLRAYGQRDPLVEYKKEALIMFKELLDNYEKMLIESILHASINQKPLVQMQSVAEDRSSTGPKDETGRNDLCPCGSGKKYKKCHGK